MDYTNVVSNEEDVTVPHQRAMLDACKAGKRSALETLFQEHNVRKGDDGVPYLKPPPTGAPPTNILFATAIRHGQKSILEFLQSIYPRVDLAGHIIVNAFLERPDVAMLRLVHSQSRHICSFNFNSRGNSFLTEAFQRGPDHTPLIHFLLDHGNITPAREIMGFRPPLIQALQHQQPVEIIEKIVSKTHVSNSDIDEAIRLKRADALRVIFTRGKIEREDVTDEGHDKRLLGWAQLTKDEEVVGVVEGYIQQRKLKRGWVKVERVAMPVGAVQSKDTV